MSLQETLASIAKSGLPLQGKLDALSFEHGGQLVDVNVDGVDRALDRIHGTHPNCPWSEAQEASERRCRR